jgi:diadenosine tetraphosphate (Ap4A) HIT family hydrolase
MTLHPQLKKDCFVFGSFKLSLLLLLNDKQYPWFILVPQIEGMKEGDYIKEIHHLSPKNQQQLMIESSILAEMLEATFEAHKINIAALGNMAPQLHIHHIARFTDDPAWPKPVWGALPALPYENEEIETLKQLVQKALPSLNPSA